jgi:MFS family permease
LAAAADSAEAHSAPKVGAYAWYALLVLVLVYAVNFVDRQILSILAEDIKRDLKVDDAQIGFLYGTAFAVFYALFGIPLGRLADSWYRGRLMAIGLTLWSSMTALSGLANSFGVLALCRIGVGIGEASASPAAYSMISDLFPKERRATALSIYSAGLYIGGGLALPIGGFVLSRWNGAYPDPALAPLGLTGWQAAFIAVGLPGLFLAAWMLSLKEPQRGGMDGQPQPAARPGAWAEFGRELVAILPPLTLLSVSRIPGALLPNLLALAAVVAGATALIAATGTAPQWIAYGIGVYAIFSWVQSLKHRDLPTHRLIWGTPLVVLMAIAFGTLAFVNYAATFWTPPYVLRTFYPDPTGPGLILGGMKGTEEVALIVGTTGAISSAIGVIGGGVLSDWWRRRDARGRLFVCMLAALLPFPVLLYMLTTDSLAGLYWANPLANLFGSMWVGASVASLQDVVLPRMRATAGATFILGTTMVGLALGPFTAGKVAVLAGGLTTGILSLFVIAPFTVAALWLVGRRIAELENNKVERARAAGEPV